MKIRMPFCTSFEIVGHRIGAPVREPADAETGQPVRRSYLPFKVRLRPAWIDPAGDHVPSPRAAPLPRQGHGAAPEAAFRVVDNPLATGQALVEIAALPPTEEVGALARQAPMRLSEHLEALQDWIDGGPDAERMERCMAGDIFRQYWTNPTLTSLIIGECSTLTSLPALPPTLTRFGAWNCPGLATPPDVSRCTQLTSLNISYCPSLTSLPDLSQCPQLRTLNISGCIDLRAPPNLSQCPHLTDLSMSYCSRMAMPPDLSRCPQLTALDISDYPSQATLPDLSRCRQLKTLNMSECNGLTALPDLSQCQQLTNLNMSYCLNLATPPDLSQCSSLTILDMSGCSTLSAPPDVSRCPQLRALKMPGCNNLTMPPDVSQCRQLATLDMADCISLNAPPDLLQCTQLSILSMSYCPRLTTLPALGHLQQMRELDLRGTPLTSLPDDILHVHQDCIIQLDASRLSNAVRNQLFHILNGSDYDGPRIFYTMGDAPRHAASPLLEQEVAAWRAEALPLHSGALPAATDEAVWRTLPAQDHVASFATFLSRLRETNDYRHATPALKAATRQRVNALLDQLQTDHALRENCFNLAFDAVNSCGDRIALRLMDMEMLCLNQRALTAISNGEYDARPQALITLCKGQYRLQVLTSEAKQKVARMNFTDEIEVHLGYLVHLSERYQLPVQIATMLYPRCAGVTAQDLARAEAQLSSDNLPATAQEKNDQAYHTFLARSPLMRSLLARLCGDAMTAANAGNARLIEESKDSITEQLAQLDPEDPNHARHSTTFMHAFHALEGDIAARATQPVLLAFLAQHGISASL